MAKKPMTKAQIASHFSKKFGLAKNTAAMFLDEIAALAISETKKTGVFVIPGIGILVPPGDDVSDDNDSTIDDIQEIARNKRITETEKKALMLNRIGQGDFRKRLMTFWGEKCSITGFSNKDILRASHIKPWRVSNNKERLDVYNGFLLIPNLDILFDKGFISFGPHGNIIFSPHLKQRDRKILGVSNNMKVTLQEEHQKYLRYHRDNVLVK
jgi:putative restriction endonuclease